MEVVGSQVLNSDQMVKDNTSDFPSLETAFNFFFSLILPFFVENSHFNLVLNFYYLPA